MSEESPVREPLPGPRDTGKNPVPWQVEHAVLGMAHRLHPCHSFSQYRAGYFRAVLEAPASLGLEELGIFCHLVRDLLLLRLLDRDGRLPGPVHRKDGHEPAGRQPGRYRINYPTAAIESFGKAFLLPLDCLIGWLAMPGSQTPGLQPDLQYHRHQDRLP